MGDHIPDSLPSESSPLTLCRLPSELIDHILSYLCAEQLARVSRVNKCLRSHAHSDLLWQHLVQDNVPGVKLTESTPCPSFRELYVKHDPRWFLTRHRIWFCDHVLTGKLIIVRFDPRRGVIEGYQLVATTKRVNLVQWSDDKPIFIHPFQPEVRLHLDKPVLQLRADNTYDQLRQDIAATATMGSGSAEQFDNSAPSSRIEIGSRPAFLEEMPMYLDDRPTDTMFSNLLLARDLDEESKRLRMNEDRLHRGLWPPATIPSEQRVRGSNVHDRGDIDLDDWPRNRAQISDTSFRIRTWIEMRQTHRFWSNLYGAARRGVASVSPAVDPPPAADIDEAEANEDENEETTLANHPWHTNYLSPQQMVGMHLGEEVSTFSTLDPELYTPTEDMPWRGIWVGDYSGHGCEFLLIHQVHDGPVPEVNRYRDETDEQFAQRQKDARIYRGRLEAIKLTGDPNIPRGEYTFVADDLGEEGYVTTEEEGRFKGTRVVESKGHIADHGFENDRWIESQLLLISTNQIAQHWIGFAHVNFFERVDIDKFIVPS